MPPNAMRCSKPNILQLSTSNRTSNIQHRLFAAFGVITSLLEQQLWRALPQRRAPLGKRRMGTDFIDAEDASLLPRGRRALASIK